MKTKPESVSVADFLAAVEPPNRRADGITLCEFMTRVTGQPPVMWGPSIIGFGKYHYTYDSGRSGEWFRIGFSPRKAKMVVYIYSVEAVEPGLLSALGKVKLGKGCIDVAKLTDIDLGVLEKVITGSMTTLAKRFPD